MDQIPIMPVLFLVFVTATTTGIASTKTTATNTVSTATATTTVATSTASNTATATTTPTTSITATTTATAAPTTSITATTTATAAPTTSITATATATASTASITATATIPTASTTATPTITVTPTSSVTVTPTPFVTTTTPAPPTTTENVLDPRAPDVEKIAALKVAFQFTIKFKQQFTDDLKDPKSSEYKYLKSIITEKLTKIYKDEDSPGFQELDVKKFKNGSIIAFYQAIYEKLHVLSNITGIVHFLKAKAIPEMRSTKFSTNYTQDITYINVTVVKEVNAAKTLGMDLRKAICDDHGTTICRNYETCHPDQKYLYGAYCWHKCNKNVKPCKSNGVCTLAWDFKPVCSCNEGYILEGKDTCVKRLDKGVILGVSLGVGIPLVLGLVLVIGYLANKLKKAEEDNSFGSTPRLGLDHVNRGFQMDSHGTGNVYTDAELRASNLSNVSGAPSGGKVGPPMATFTPRTEL